MAASGEWVFVFWFLLASLSKITPWNRLANFTISLYILTTLRCMDFRFHEIRFEDVSVVLIDRCATNQSIDNSLIF